MKTHKILDSKNLILFVGTFDECSNFMESHNTKHQFTYNCQFVIATHCYPLINEFNVISLEHNKQMKGSDFIKLVTN